MQNAVVADQGAPTARARSPIGLPAFPVSLPHKRLRRPF
jgi:hypothetical protein